MITKLNVLIKQDLNRSSLKLPVLFIDNYPFLPLLHYMIDRNTSPSKNEKLIQAWKLFLNFFLVKGNLYNSPKNILSEFIKNLYDGTIGQDGIDHSNLYWEVRNIKNANTIISEINCVFDYFLEINPNATHLNPWRKATTLEQKILTSAWYYKKNNSFFNHLIGKDDKSNNTTKKRSAHQRIPTSFDKLNNTKSFPEEIFSKLLVEGFRNRKNISNSDIFKISHETHNIRDILITLLMHYGGLRISEVFHLYVTDVIPVPDDSDDSDDSDIALVRIFHPEYGLPPEDKSINNRKSLFKNRRDWLNKKYGLHPRNILNKDDIYYAGWKNLRLDDQQNQSITIQWFPKSAGKIFLKLWYVYLIERAKHTRLSKKHPYAFVNLEGHPYTIKSYQNARDRAFKRIDLINSTSYGTNTHSHRHAYGQRLADCHVTDKVIMKCMHHNSLKSQLIYTSPTQERVRTELDIAEKKLQEKISKYPSKVDKLSTNASYKIQSILDLENLIRE